MLSHDNNENKLGNSVLSLNDHQSCPEELLDSLWRRLAKHSLGVNIPLEKCDIISQTMISQIGIFKRSRYQSLVFSHTLENQV